MSALFCKLTKYLCSRSHLFVHVYDDLLQLPILKNLQNSVVLLLNPTFEFVPLILEMLLDPPLRIGEYLPILPLEQDAAGLGLFSGLP